MKVDTIMAEVVEIQGKAQFCPGLAKTRMGEKFLIDGRTPESPGMCSNAFSALSNAVFVLMSSDRIPLDENGGTIRVCPHGAVKFRLSRSKTEKAEAFSNK